MESMLKSLDTSRNIDAIGGVTQGFVTLRVDKQLIGVSVMVVQDILRSMRITHIPLSPPEVAGLMNLRGRIVTVVDVRKRLQLPERAEGVPVMHAVVEYRDELYSLMVDGIGEVLNLPVNSIEKNPANMEAGWRDISAGVYRLQKELMVLIDVQALLRF